MRRCFILSPVLQKTVSNERFLVPLLLILLSKMKGVGRYFVGAFVTSLTLLGMIRGETAGEKGLHIVGKTYESVCWYETYKPYDGTVVTNCNPKTASSDAEGTISWINSFGPGWSKDTMLIQDYTTKSQNSLNSLPQFYQDACGRYLENSKKKYRGDKSGLVDDESSDNYPFSGYAHCLASTLHKKYGDEAIKSVKSGIKPAQKSTEGFPEDVSPHDQSDQNPDTAAKKGLDVVGKTYEKVCWYEIYKPYDDNDDSSCSPKTAISNAEGTISWINSLSDNYSKGSMLVNDFTTKCQNALKDLPQSYKDACGPYLDDINKKFEGDQSGLVDDGGSDNYPFSGYAHCLASTLHTKFGDKAIQAVKSGVKPPQKSFTEAFLEADNGKRAKHGSPPLQSDPQLTQKAQAWADQLANEICRLEHNSGGQNAFAGGADENFNEVRTAHSASRSWYSELPNYPFPRSIDDICGNGGYTDEEYEVYKKCYAQFGVFGHFTQLVWKSADKVGYAYAIGKEGGPCPGSLYVIADYSTGNVAGAYKHNVLPPQ